MYCLCKQPLQNIKMKFYTFLKFNIGNGHDFFLVCLACGGVYSAPTAVINSPKDSDEYPHEAKCTWIIHVEEGQVIQLRFNSFNLEEANHANSCFDYLAIYDNTYRPSQDKLMGE